MILIAQNLARPPALVPLSLTIEPGELVALIGPNGAGKTTLLRALAGLTRGPGSVTADGADLATMAPAVRARYIAWLPADRGIAWPMRARDVVGLGLLPLGGDDPAAIDSALVAVDALAFGERRVDMLSTGERARVLLARALVAGPALLLLDEPVANLDPYYRIAVLDILRTQADRGVGVLVALHDLELAAARCDRLLLLDKGKLVAAGRPQDVLTPEALASIFRVRHGAGGWHRA